MTKITVEEALKSITNIKNTCIHELPENIMWHNTENNVYLDLETVEEFIKQNLTPTLDDVVKAWQEHDPLYDRIELDENGDVVVWYDSTSPRTGPYGLPLDNWYTFSISRCEVWWEPHTSMDRETLDLINLTIKYLESQKENKND